MLVLGKSKFSELRNKKGLSNIIAYVLLIGISLSLSVMVYGWLKFYVGGAEVVACPNNVNIIIDSYSCSSDNLTVTVKNKGLFDIDGYVLRVHNRTNAEFGIYTFNERGSFLIPGDKVPTTYVFPFSVDDLTDVTSVTLAEVQPFVIINDKDVYCESRSSQKINCN